MAQTTQLQVGKWGWQGSCLHYQVRAGVGLAREGGAQDSGWPAWNSWWFPALGKPPLLGLLAVAGQGPHPRKLGVGSVPPWFPSCVREASHFTSLSRGSPISENERSETNSL